MHLNVELVALKKKGIWPRDPMTERFIIPRGKDFFSIFIGVKNQAKNYANLWRIKDIIKREAGAEKASPGSSGRRRRWHGPEGLTPRMPQMNRK